ncbi:hypothetical protein P5V15_010550, partial [Pogonomyrmex californicus]
MLEPEVEATVVNLRRGSSLRIPSTSPSTEESELGLRRSGSLRISRDDPDIALVRERARLTSTRSSPSSTLSLSTTSTSSSAASSEKCAVDGENSRSSRFARRYAPAAASDAPAPEYLARSLLQLGCPAVSMPT